MPIRLLLIACLSASVMLADSALPAAHKEAVLRDLITLKNGDKLSGQIVKSDAKTVTLKSDMAGAVTIPWENVEAVTGDLTVTLKDGRVLAGKVQAKAAEWKMETGPGKAPVTLDRQNIAVMRSAAEQAAYEKERRRLNEAGPFDLWTGTLDTGFTASRGNTETTSANVNLNATRTTPLNQYRVHLTTLYGRSGTYGTPMTLVNGARGGASYSLNLRENTFASASADFEFDELQKLDLRQVLAGSYGRHAIKSEHTTFDVFAGGSLNKENFATGVRRESGELLSGTEFNYQLTRTIALHGKLTVFPNVTDPGQYRVNFDSSATTALRKWLGFHVSVTDRYLSDPVAELQKNDFLLTTGLRLSFAH